jgi:predicted nucleic acid-binding protein
LIVVDASAIVDLLLPAPDIAELEKRLWGDPSWHAPHLLDLEVAQVLRRWVLAGRIPPATGERAIRDLSGLPITRYPHEVLLPRIWQLRVHLTAYDAAYVALAEALAAPLITRDARSASAPGHQARVEVF